MAKKKTGTDEREEFFEKLYESQERRLRELVELRKKNRQRALQLSRPTAIGKYYFRTSAG